MRFNLVMPGLEPREMSDVHKAALDMAMFADEQGFSTISLGSITEPTMAGARRRWSSPVWCRGARGASGVTISALLLPLHDPLRVAEDIAVLDLTSGGRLMTVVGLGCRRSEYAADGKDWARRGRLMDEAVQALLDAWTGEPFEYRGATVRVTPRPLTQPHPLLLVGGTSAAAAKRAARFGLPFFPAAHLPDLEALYYEECAARGVSGFCVMPADDTFMLHVADDPDQAWAELGSHFLHEATTYSGWQTPDIASVMHSRVTTVQELRAEGIYRVMTPDECVDLARTEGEEATFCLHPMCGGVPIDRAWASAQLFTDKAWPRINGATSTHGDTRTLGERRRRRPFHTVGSRHARRVPGAVVVRAVHRVGVELWDDVLADQPDRFQRRLVRGPAETEHQLIGAGSLPPAALLQRLIGVTADDPELGGPDARSRVSGQAAPGASWGCLGVREGVVVAVDVAHEVPTVRRASALDGLVVVFGDIGRGRHHDVVVHERADRIRITDRRLVAVITGSSSCSDPTLKPSTPSPLRAAIS